MILQMLLFPDEIISESRELYIREENNTISFETYFNLFSIQKWLHYTAVTDISLRLEAVGNFNLIFSDQSDVLLKKKFSLTEKREITLKLPYKNTSSIIWFRIEKLSNNAKIFKGAYETTDTALRNPKLALAICTYRREKAVSENLELLKKQLIYKTHHDLANKLHVYISDNGRTLQSTLPEKPEICIFPNINAGGAGGFTRCLIEILKRQMIENYTHVVFMDDDIKILPEAFVRTYALLSYLKPEYEDACISGAMLRRDFPFIQHENGALWQGDNPIIKNPELDLRNKAVLPKNEEPQKSDYPAWWFGCYSLKIVKKIGLPLPLFVHGDDIEYGLRAKQEVILLNGICVWHEAFENKRASALSYYDVRNLLLLNALYSSGYGYVNMKHLTFRRMVSLLFRYRYKDVELLCRGIEDFCKGIDWLKNQNPEILNQEIIQRGYQLKPIKELTAETKILKQIADYSCCSAEKPHSSYTEQYGLKYPLTLNGWIFPAKNDRIYAHPIGVYPYKLYRQKNILLFEPDSKKGILLKKSYRKAIKCLVMYTKTIRQLKRQYKTIGKDYRKRISELTTLEFWANYLEI